MADPVTENLYIVGEDERNGSEAEILATLSIDPGDGQLAQTSFQQSFPDLARSAAISPNGRFLFLGLGTNTAQIILNNAFVFQSTANGSYPASMAVDSSNSYLFTQILGGSLLEFSIASSGALTQTLPGPSPAISAGESPMVADPTGPFLYFENGNAFEISSEGTLTALSGFPLLRGSALMLLPAELFSPFPARQRRFYPPPCHSGRKL